MNALTVNSLRKDQLSMAKNYALYYGYGRIEELSLFDIAIVEPKGVTLTDIQKLKNNNTLVIAYLSFIEVHPYEPIFFDLEDEDFIFVNGKKLMNESFGTYIVNLKSKKWIQHLLKEIEYRFLTLGVDGIFLDTIGDIEMTLLPPSMKEKQLKRAVNFLYTIRLLYSKHLIIQNNGLEDVCLKTAPYIDGICWENPPLTLEGSRGWVKKIIERLNKLQSQHSIKIFLLLEETLEHSRRGYKIAQKQAKANNYLLYNAPKQYVAFHQFSLLKSFVQLNRYIMDFRNFFNRLPCS